MGESVVGGSWLYGITYRLLMWRWATNRSYQHHFWATPSLLTPKERNIKMACKVMLTGGHALITSDRDFESLVEQSGPAEDDNKYIMMSARRDGTQANVEKAHAVRARDIVAIEDLS